MYQVLHKPRIVTPLHRAGLAPAVLTHPSLHAGGAQAAGETSAGPLPPWRPCLLGLRAALRRERIEALVKRVRHKPRRRRWEKAFLEFAEAAGYAAQFEWLTTCCTSITPGRLAQPLLSHPSQIPRDVSTGLAQSQ